MVAWPSSLPAPALDTLREKPPQNRIRTSMDKGPKKSRRRTTANVRPLAFTLKLTDAQLETLDTFFVTTTNSGVTEFDYTHPRTGDSVTAQFGDDPLEYAEKAGVIWDVPINLEILP